MEILIDDIPEDGLTIKSSTNEDDWLKQLIEESIGERFAKGDKVNIVTTFLNFDGNIDVKGDMVLWSHPTCDRCLKVYREKREIPFHFFMVPTSQSRDKRKKEQDDLVCDDVEFGQYEGDRIDLAEIIRETILLEDPIKHLCRDDCAGICQRCGKDLNKAPCGCIEEKRDPRWDALKNFKAKKE